MLSDCSVARKINLFAKLNTHIYDAFIYYFFLSVLFNVIQSETKIFLIEI